MSSITPIERLQDWYKSRCNRDWEHGYGVRIETIDNPGWHVQIDLAETGLETREFSKAFDKDKSDWYFIRVKDQKFEGFCDPDKLEFLLEFFLNELCGK